MVVGCGIDGFCGHDFVFWRHAVYVVGFDMYIVEFKHVGCVYV